MHFTQDHLEVAAAQEAVAKGKTIRMVRPVPGTGLGCDGSGTTFIKVVASAGSQSSDAAERYASGLLAASGSGY